MTVMAFPGHAGRMAASLALARSHRNDGRPVTTPLLRVEHLVKTYSLRGRLLGGSGPRVQAVSDVSFDVARGETLSLVGESGCGKSTVARCVTRLVEPDSGSILLDGTDLASLRAEPLRRLRRRFQIVFQDPQASLNPRMTVAQLIAEPLEVHRIDGRRRRRASPSCCDSCSCRPTRAGAIPHQFSGGQRQRIGIARALAVSPDLLVLDEPVSALDVSIQAEIIRLLERLRGELDLGFLFIAHDLAVVRHLSDRVAVMYLGRIVETGTAAEVYEHPAHPYTLALAVGGADSRPARRATPPSHRARGRAAPGDRPTVGMPVPHPVLEGHRTLRRGNPGARRPRRRSRRRLPLPRGHGAGRGPHVKS